MDESQTAAPRANRQRPPRVLSEEQQLILRIRAKINSNDNGHRHQDVSFLDDIRKTNHDTNDLMLAFDKVSTRYTLFTVFKIHEMLTQQGVQQPSSFIDDDALYVALAINETPSGFSRAWDRTLFFNEAKAGLMTFALTAGALRDQVLNIIQERGIRDVQEIKSLIADIGDSHCSLAAGAL